MCQVYRLPYSLKTNTMKIVTTLLFIVLSVSTYSQDSIILGGGCFWCVEAVFESIKGVENVVAGYSGSDVINPTYKEVCKGETGHAEVVQVYFDSHQISLTELLDVFFHIHDPTTPNRQGADIGSQYRSIIFYNSVEQLNIIVSVIDKLQTQYENSIVTELRESEIFYPADLSHQDFYQNNKNIGYCRAVITPKLKMLKNEYQLILK